MCEHLPELAEDPWICSTFSLHYLFRSQMKLLQITQTYCWQNGENRENSEQGPQKSRQRNENASPLFVDLFASLNLSPGAKYAH